MAKLLLNMIVKNEAVRIERALASVADYIEGAVIIDTGSTDGTDKVIKKFFKKRHIPCAIYNVPFVNFSQARNTALEHARAWVPMKYDYILLMDADMELVIEDKGFLDKLPTALSYDVIQKGGTLSYHNRRLIHRHAPGEYRGVTHEYLDVAPGGLLKGVWFRDHADGANRKDKYTRDIALLLPETLRDPKNERNWFYLAQSYRDAGRPAEACVAYRQRVALGGWDEEVWNAQMNVATCLRDMGDDDGFIREMLIAYNMRPQRAETLYDLAKYFREKGLNAASVVFSEAGMKVPRPDDTLFVSDYVYDTGLREEFSISAFYNPLKRRRGFEACNSVSLDPKVWEGSREQARNNLFFYIEPLASMIPMTAHRIPFKAPEDWTALNPSVANVNGQIVTTMRTVNYTILPSGHYSVRGDNGTYSAEHPIRTRNFLVRLSDKFEPLSSKEIHEPLMPPPEFPLVRGFEDMRLFEHAGDLHVSACMRELNPEGYAEQVVARVVEGSDRADIDGWFRIRPKVRQHEKNWMPWAYGGKVNFVYRLGQIIDKDGNIQHQVPALGIDASRLSGGSQLIPFRGGWLAVVHEARPLPDGKRYYNHRFVWFDMAGAMRFLSLPFVFHEKQIEFCAGLAWHPDGERIMLSYGVKDSEAWIVTVDAMDVNGMLHHD